MECGNCPIGELQTTAYELGYSVLIAEGTTMVTKLIQTKMIKGVIGVSCLSVLEKSFPYLCNNAVPGLAVPLIRDGCVDTECDTDRILEFIKLRSRKKSEFVDIDKIKQNIKNIFSYENVKIVINDDSITSDIAVVSLTKAGKRWRPLITSLMYKILKPATEIFSDGFTKVLIAIECFHKASLVHDDIEDDDDIRYGDKTLHNEYNIPLAINTGDYLLGQGYKLMAGSGFDSSIVSEIIHIAAKAHCDLSIGQGEELYWMHNPYVLTVKKVIEIFKYKTSPAFEVALKIGAVLGNAAPAYSEA
jgi:geranylgeranyl diphosphate synthase type II